MYIEPGKDILVLICEDSADFPYWNKIIKEQSAGLSTLQFGANTFHQINATIIKNVSRNAFINGEYDNDLMDYHVLGIGGAAISLSFLGCAYSTDIELKFSQILMDSHIQIWGLAPMRRNLLRVLQRRASSTRMSLLKCMLDEFTGDHAQSLQLAMSAQQIIQLEETKKIENTKVDYDVVFSQVKKDNKLGVRIVKNALTTIGYESALLQFNSVVQNTMMTAVSKMYGHFSSPNSPIISNSQVFDLVQKYIELMPVHHAAIMTMLNADQKVKDKRCHYLATQYERVSFWIFLSTMRSRNNHLFTWWANISTAARYGAKTDSSASFSEAVFFGCATTHNTLIRNTAQYRDDQKNGKMVYTDQCRNTIRTSHEDFIVIAMDNNQRGQRRKQQRHGISNQYIVVTHSMALQPQTTTSKELLSGGIYNHKPIISYLEQQIVSVHNMSGFESINTMESVGNFLVDENSINVPVLPDFSGNRVNHYYAIIKICYGLVLQRQFLSRDTTVFKFVDEERVINTRGLVNILHCNRNVDGLYNNARKAQKKRG